MLLGERGPIGSLKETGSPPPRARGLKRTLERGHLLHGESRVHLFLHHPAPGSLPSRACKLPLAHSPFPSTFPLPLPVPKSKNPPPDAS